MTAHKVISPSLVGLSSASGFSSVADEMDMSERQTIKRVIKPKQDFIIDAIEEVLVNYGINLDLYFAPLTEEKIEEAAELSTHVCMSEDIELSAILEKYALDPPEGYELTDGKEYDVKMSAKQTSEQDTKLWKTRYAYTVGTSKTPKGASRTFCNKMISLSDSGKVYRKEDIELMSMQGVNGKFAHSGGKYDIFLYGGGVNCYHRWERRVFKKKLNEDGKPKGGGAMQQTTSVNVNEAKRQGYKPVKNAKDVAIAEIDKPNNGRYK